MAALNQDIVLASHQCIEKEYMCYVCRVFEMFLGQNNKFGACLDHVREFSKLTRGCLQAMESLQASPLAHKSSTM